VSGLHQAVTRAIRDASHGAPGAPLPVHNDKRWDDTTRPDCQTCNAAAAAAIRVCLTEAQRAVESAFDQERECLADAEAYPREVARDARIALAGGNRALAVLAALAEDTP
jgi:hypothetical protein